MAKTITIKYKYNKEQRNDRRFGRKTIIKPTSEILDGIRYIKEQIQQIKNIKDEINMQLTLDRIQMNVSADIINAYQKHPELYKNI